ncbi:MAG TPA: glycosyltransferase family 9 protein [Candidatus Acidoferrales bacterium]|nr:glycosyltransferase family 9 protein [Candidatus Acidoferrales bacterium]
MNLREPSAILPGLPRGAEVLIVRLRSLGDLVLSTPAIAALHAWRPDLRVSVLVEKPYAAVLEGNPAVAEIFLAKNFLAMVKELRQRRFPVAFNQHAGPKSALLIAAIGAPVRVCWERRQFSFVYNVLASDPVGPMHTVEHRMAQFYAAGLPRGPIPSARVYPQPDAHTAIARMLAEKGIATGSAYAVLRPGAKYFTKRWAMEKFVGVARWLRDKNGIEPVFNLGGGEAEIAEEVRRGCGNEFVLLDALDLRQLIALIAGCKLFIANDSGPTHLAAAVGRPVVAIFGSSSSVHWRPWATRHRVVQNDFPCNPCRGDRCYAFAEPRCILSVTMEQVREACEALLAGKGAKNETIETGILSARRIQ